MPDITELADPEDPWVAADEALNQAREVQARAVTLVLGALGVLAAAKLQIDRLGLEATWASCRLRWIRRHTRPGYEGRQYWNPRLRSEEWEREHPGEEEPHWRWFHSEEGYDWWERHLRSLGDLARRASKARRRLQRRLECLETNNPAQAGEDTNA